MFSEILQQIGTDWKLAGLYIKPAQIAGHDSTWFLTRAREFKTKGQMHNAFFYFQEARSLASPLPFMSTLQTDTMFDESQNLQPTDLPLGGKLADLPGGTVTYKLTAVFPQAVGDDLDLIVKYQSNNVTNTNRRVPGQCCSDEGFRHKVSGSQRRIRRHRSPRCRDQRTGLRDAAADERHQVDGDRRAEVPQRSEILKFAQFADCVDGWAPERPVSRRPIQQLIGHVISHESQYQWGQPLLQLGMMAAIPMTSPSTKNQKTCFAAGLGAKRAQTQAHRIETTTKNAVLANRAVLDGMRPFSKSPGNIRESNGSVAMTSATDKM